MRYRQLAPASSCVRQRAHAADALDASRAPRRRHQPGIPHEASRGRLSLVRASGCSDATARDENAARRGLVTKRQRAEARREEYNQATAANIAAFSVTRDIGSDRSVQAFLERQKEIVAQDLGRMDTQAAFETAKYEAAAATEIRRGKNVQRASLFSAIGTLGEGAYRYDQVKT